MLTEDPIKLVQLLTKIHKKVEEELNHLKNKTYEMYETPLIIPRLVKCQYCLRAGMEGQLNKWARLGLCDNPFDSIEVWVCSSCKNKL